MGRKLHQEKSLVHCSFRRRPTNCYSLREAHYMIPLSLCNWNTKEPQYCSGSSNITSALLISLFPSLIFQFTLNNITKDPISVLFLSSPCIALGWLPFIVFLASAENDLKPNGTWPQNALQLTATTWHSTFSMKYDNGSLPRGTGGSQLSTTYVLLVSEACTLVGGPGILTSPRGVINPVSVKCQINLSGQHLWTSLSFWTLSLECTAWLSKGYNIAVAVYPEGCPISILRN